MKSQFIRVEPYALKDVYRILGEAERVPEFCRHVENPLIPKWWLGSSHAVLEAVKTHMVTPTPVTRRDGTLGQRKRRTDHRCLVAGVASWPDAIEELRSAESRQRAAQLRVWISNTIEWLRQQFGDRLIGVVSHADEGFPHLHFFCAGDANQIHPGLRAEHVDGQRLRAKKEKRDRYIAAMRAFLDDYFVNVGSKFGLQRHPHGTAAPRIKNRAIALRVLRLEQRLHDRQDAEELAQIRELASKTKHGMRS